MTFFALDILLARIKVVNMRSNIFVCVFLLTARGALDKLAHFAAVCASSKLAVRLPLSAARAECTTIADIADLLLVSAAIFHC